MQNLSKVIAAGLFVAASFTSLVQPTNAVSANFPGAAVSKINSQGFKTCKAMGDSGYTAVARGILGDGGGGENSGGFRYFQIRTCFKTSASCEKFIKRIDHKISQIERLNYARCKSRT